MKSNYNLLVKFIMNYHSDIYDSVLRECDGAKIIQINHSNLQSFTKKELTKILLNYFPHHIFFLKQYISKT